MKRLGRIQLLAAAAAMSTALAVPLAFGQNTGTPPAGSSSGQVAGANGMPGRHMAYRNRMQRNAFRQLDLTADQKTQIRQIRQKERPEILALRKDVRAKRQEIRQAYQNGSFNEAVATQKLTELAPIEAKLMAERYKVHQEILSVLTPQQKEKLQQLREQRKMKVSGSNGQQG